MNSLIPTKTEYSIMARQAQHLVESGLLPQTINTPQKALAILMLGRELGIPAWQSINGIHVIQGRPTVSPQLMLALIERSGKLKDIKIEATDEMSKVTMERVSRTPHSVSFSLQDAQKMGLTGKDNWKKQAKVMLQWRAVAACARIVFPDVICGLYLTEEINPEIVVSEEGEVIEAKIVPQKEIKTETATAVLPTPENVIEAPSEDNALEDEDKVSPAQLKALWTLTNKRLPPKIAEFWLRTEMAKMVPPVESSKDLSQWQFQGLMTLLNNVTNDEIAKFCTELEPTKTE